MPASVFPADCGHPFPRGWSDVYCDRVRLEFDPAVLLAEPLNVDPNAAQEALEPTLWLLGRANDGVKLTQTGALNRALVREVAERWPGWWHAELFGPPHRETDVTPLQELDELLRSLRLLRRRGPRIFTTKRCRELQEDPAALLQVLTDGLLAGESFEGACAELAAELILSGAKPDYSDRLASRIQPIILDQGWHAAGVLPDIRDISWAIAAFLRPAEAVGLLEREGGAPRYTSGPLVLRDVGRAALFSALRAR